MANWRRFRMKLVYYITKHYSSECSVQWQLFSYQNKVWQQSFLPWNVTKESKSIFILLSASLALWWVSLVCTPRDNVHIITGLFFWRNASAYIGSTLANEWAVYQLSADCPPFVSVRDTWIYHPWTKWLPCGRRHFQMHVPGGPIDNNSALVQVMAWRQTGAKPLPGPRLTMFTNAYMWHSEEMS